MHPSLSNSPNTLYCHYVINISWRMTYTQKLEIEVFSDILPIIRFWLKCAEYIIFNKKNAPFLTTHRRISIFVLNIVYEIEMKVRPKI